MRSSYLIITGVIFVCMVLSAGCVSEESSMDAALSDALDMTLAGLDDNAMYVACAANEIANGKTDADSSRQVLANLYQKSTLAQTIMYVNESMTAVSVYPNIISSSVGTNQSVYGTDEAYYAGKDVVLTKYMHLDDGTNASVLSAPVYINGVWKGYVSMSFDSSRLFGDIEEYLTDVYGYHLFVIQTDGIQVYDYDLGERGKNIDSLPEYEEETIQVTIDLFKEEKSGTSAYFFNKTGSDEIVEKSVVWDTLEFGGQTWRIIVISE